MSRAKKASKRKSRPCAVPLLGAAGLSLSMVSGAPAATVGPTAHEILLGEEEISDVSLATFYVFDKENVGTSEPAVQLARRRGCGGCRGCRGCRGCHRGCGCGGCGGCVTIWWGGCGGCGGCWGWRYLNGEGLFGPPPSFFPRPATVWPRLPRRC